MPGTVLTVDARDGKPGRGSGEDLDRHRVRPIPMPPPHPESAVARSHNQQKGSRLGAAAFCMSESFGTLPDKGRRIAAPHKLSLRFVLAKEDWRVLSPAL